MVVALSNGVETAWWVACGVLLVVALVVWTLLEILRRTVLQVRRGVDDILTIGGRLAQNTWTIQLLKTTTERAADLLAELEQLTSSREGTQA
jgi:hypothetical protein